MIIGLAGLKGSGKDTAAAYLIKQHGYQRRAFADPLKRAVAALLDIPFHEIENFKNDDTCYVTIGYKNSPSGQESQPQPSNMWSPIREQTFREFLQNFGQTCREVFGEDFWVDQTLPLDGFYTNTKIAVSDCRYPNECDRIHKKGGKVILIEKAGVFVDKNAHSSERPDLLDYDYKVMNNGTVEQLGVTLNAILEQLELTKT